MEMKLVEYFWWTNLCLLAKELILMLFAEINGKFQAMYKPQACGLFDL